VSQPIQSPVAYKIGYTSLLLATMSVPQGTTDNQLRELLNYFHSLKINGELSKVMTGHTVIDIFNDEKLTTKENYNDLTQGKKYCDYIKATYSVGIDGVERAGLGSGNCKNYEEVIKPIVTPTSTTRMDFKASVKFTGTQFIISNLDDSDCIGSKMEINSGLLSGGYVLEGYTLETGKTYTVGALQFAKGEKRLNPLEVKPNLL
jgi:hypothetical protein